MTIDAITSNDSRTSEKAVYIVLIIEYSICFALILTQAMKKLSFSLRSFYLCIMLQISLLIAYLLKAFLHYDEMVYTILYCANNVLSVNAVQIMVFEWLNIVLLSKSISIIQKRRSLNKCFYSILSGNLLLWAIFTSFILLAIYTSASLIRLELYSLMLALALFMALLNMLSVSISGYLLVKTYKKLLGEYYREISVWIYVGVFISFIKLFFSIFYLLYQGSTTFFYGEAFRDIYLIVSHNFSYVLPMLVYHKSFRLSFAVLKSTNKSSVFYSRNISKMSEADSTQSLESISDYILI